jgi:hypothetical protein
MYRRHRQTSEKRYIEKYKEKSHEDSQKMIPFGREEPTKKPKRKKRNTRKMCFMRGSRRDDGKSLDGGCGPSAITTIYTTARVSCTSDDSMGERGTKFTFIRACKKKKKILLLTFVIRIE